MTDKVLALRRTAMFGELGEPELAALSSRAVEQHLAEGEVLFVAGEEARGLYVVVEGAVRAFRDNPDGRQQVIHVESAGSTIAEIPVFDDGPYPSTVVADKATTVLFIDKRDVRRFCLEHPRVGLAALRLLAGRVRRSAELAQALSLQDVDQRLAHFILKEFRASRAAGQTVLSFDLKLTNHQIASHIGSVREVVSRALTRLQQDGLIVVDGRRITVKDEQALSDFISM